MNDEGRCVKSNVQVEVQSEVRVFCTQRKEKGSMTTPQCEESLLDELISLADFALL